LSSGPATAAQQGKNAAEQTIAATQLQISARFKNFIKLSSNVSSPEELPRYCPVDGGGSPAPAAVKCFG
jgi:hypothetical protein